MIGCYSHAGRLGCVVVSTAHRSPGTRDSIGQQRRLELARLMTRPADLLVVDEPTNHVALSLVEELEEALSRYEGPVVAVSHDRRFRSGFAGDRLELRSGVISRAG